MAIAARPPYSPTRARTVGWLVLISLLVVLINAVVSGVRRDPNLKLATSSFVDRMRPFILDSNAESAELNRIRAGFARKGDSPTPADDAKSLQRRLDKLTRDVQVTNDQALSVNPPKTVRQSASLAWSSLSLRSQAMVDIRDALAAVLAANENDAGNKLQDVNSQLAASDSIYDQFRHLLERQKIPGALPDSHWLSDPNSWQPNDAHLLIASWKANLSSTVIHNLSIVTVLTDPPPVRAGNEKSGPVQVMAPQHNMSVTIVVANLGNVSEKKVPVRVNIAAADGSADGKNDSVSLDPGEEHSLTFPNIRVVPDGVSTIVVTVSPVPGEANSSDNTQTITFTMNPTADTSTTASSLVATTTTVRTGP